MLRRYLILIGIWVMGINGIGFAGELDQVFSAWTDAKQSIEAKKFETAENQYQMILDNPNLKTFHTMTRLKLVQVYLADQKIPQAIALLESVKGLSDLEQAIYAEQLGDILYFSQHDLPAATLAYQKAKQYLQNNSPDQARLDLKIGVLT